MPSKLAPVPQRVPEIRRKHKLPLSAQEAESHDRELKEAAVKLVKYRAVMAYYRKEIALEATSTISGGLLTTDTIQTIINDIAARKIPTKIDRCPGMSEICFRCPACASCTRITNTDKPFSLARAPVRYLAI